MSSCHHPVILEFGFSSFGTLPRQHTHAGRMRFLSTVATLIPFHPRSPCRSHTPSSWHLAPARPHPLLGGGRRLLSSRRKADASGGEGEGEGAPAAAVPRAAVAIVARCEPPGGRTARYGLVQRANPPNRGMWSLPGGKIEAGEGTLSAARRELREETGLGEDADAATGGKGTKGALRGVRWAGGGPFTSSDSIHLGPDGGGEVALRHLAVLRGDRPGGGGAADHDRLGRRGRRQMVDHGRNPRRGGGGDGQRWRGEGRRPGRGHAIRGPTGDRLRVP